MPLRSHLVDSVVADLASEIQSDSIDQLDSSSVNEASPPAEPAERQAVVALVWFSKPLSRRGPHGPAHILRNRERDWWVAPCGARTDWHKALVRAEGFAVPPTACERCVAIAGLI